MADDEKPKIHEQDPTLLAPASRPSVPSAGQPIKAATARSLNRDTGEWTYRAKNVKAPCGTWFEVDGADFRCALKQGHEEHGHWTTDYEALGADQCGARGTLGIGGVYCAKPKGHDRHRHALKDHGEPTLADLGYVTNSARAMTGEPENTDHHTQQRYAEKAQLHAVQQQVARTADRAPDREALTIEQRMLEIERHGRLLNVDTRRESWMVKKLLKQGRDDEAKRRLRTAEQNMDRRRAA